MRELVSCARALVDGDEVTEFAFAIEDGVIVRTGSLEELREPGVSERRFGSQVVIVPGLIDCHSHAYQILLRGWADDLSFDRWRDRALYKIIPELSPDDVYDAFVRAFGEMLAGGITTVAEFFYLNGAGNAHAESAIRAAQDTGIRLILARTWMDAPNAPAAFRETIDEAASRTRDLMSRYPETTICVAPHSVHAASPEMIREAAQFAREAKCRLHIHLAEAHYEIEQTQERHGTTPLRLLEQLGALNERLVAIHAIYLDEQEKRMLAAAGASVIHNPVTNQYLGDGICDVTGFRALGVPVGLGTDANVNASILEEMRAAALLQKLTHRDGGAFGAAEAFELGTIEGAQALGMNAGALRAGYFADYAVIDANDVRVPSPVRNALVYRAQRNWIRETYVGGKPVLRAQGS